MATRRRAPVRRRRKGTPGWVWAAVAVILGLGVAAAAYWYGTNSNESTPKRAERTRAPEKAPANAAKKPAQTPAKPARPAKPATEAKPKPRFDFYTILPEMETPLPPRQPKKAAPVAKPAKPEEAARYVLQAASYRDFDDADRLKARLALAGLEANIEKVAIDGKGEFYRVRLGPYEKLDALDDADRRLVEQGIKPLRLKLRKPPA